MKTKYFIFSLFLISFVSKNYAQSDFCGTTAAHQKAIAQNPDILKIDQDIEKFTREWIANKPKNKTNDDQVYVIPIVFHIIHNYGGENISDEQVKDEVDILNVDFRKLNEDTSDVIAPFKSLIADSRIEFRLAQIDENGNCTNGIDRIQSYETYVGGDDAKLNQWPQHKYLNVWVVSTMADGVAGYAYYPSSGASNPQVDGVIILSDYIGSIGTSNANNSRALTHEIGHYLNLSHPWGSGNSPGVACGDDGVDDTPETMGWDYCPSENASKVCNDTVAENYQNYMDYSYCSVMYSLGQRDRMHATLENTIAYRNNLWSDANLIATGTDSGYSATCAPYADFYADEYLICEGESVELTDASWNGTVSSRTWSVPGGTPSSTTDESIDVTFDNPGWQEVSLTATNAQGSDTKTESAYIYVSPLTAQRTGPFFEGFGNGEKDFNDNWLVFNNDQNESKWQYSSKNGFSGGCAVLDSYESRPEESDDLISPSYDLSGMSTLYFNFKYACATAAFISDDMDDELKVYVSTDCGENWSVRATISGTKLVNNGNYSSSFVPGSSTVWTDYSIQLSSTSAEPNVRFKFAFTSGGDANNLYIDNVNISSSSSAIGTIDLISSADFQIYPNPAENNFIININSESIQYGEIEILNMLGQEVKNVFAGNLIAGENEYKTDISDLNKGVYTVCLKVGDQIYQQRLVKAEE
jgi:PKD repeat protein